MVISKIYKQILFELLIFLLCIYNYTETIMMELSNVASKITVYEIQDEIKVLQGSLKGSVGTVTSVNDGVLTATDKDNSNKVFKVNSEECVKNINVHDYVQITNGPYQGQSGFVFNCDRHVMTMYLDHTNKQVNLFYICIITFLYEIQI